MPTLISGSTGVNKITDGTIVDADVTDVAASKLTGTIADARFPSTLPAASAANLTAIPAANITGTLPAISGASLTSLPLGLNLISTTDVTDGDSYVTLSDVFDSTYDKYVLECFNFLPNTDNAAIRGNFETGGDTWNTASIYDTQVTSQCNGVIQSWINLTNASYAAFSGHGNQGNASNEQYHFTIELMQPSSTTDEKFWKGSQVGYNASGQMASLTCAGSWRTTTACTGVRFYYHSGTFKTGKIKLYGVK
jgi:hypothetical protein